ncbi:MAG: CBS domain-containing protein, partial [Roseiflexaceae bacterium]|nr:CBS domain-containing protein [Roseiflexaceae bacterium]
FVRGRDEDELLPDLVRAIRQQIRPARTAADIMSWPVRTVPDTATIDDALAQLAQTGHTALPVVAPDGSVRGLLTRRDVVTASRHGRGVAQASRYMGEPVLIAPDTTLAALRQHLAKADEVQTARLLVVGEDKRLLGIISPADVLRAIGAEPKAERGTLAAQLDQYLPATLRQLLQTAASLADQQGLALYIAGGTVRDMLLDRPGGDLDLLVEGDALALAAAFAAQTAGVVRSHAQFGTATVELPIDHTPLAIDFISARSEFYQSPGVLPQVGAATLRHDLQRRDFTINTLAIGLNGARYGQLYDFFGGRRDLERGVLRVLHSLSLLDDPTRILRAARLAARLGFQVEPRTHDLIADAIAYGMLDRLSPQRIANELRLLLGEPKPAQALALLDQWGVLAALHPALRWSEALARQFAAAAHLQPVAAETAHVLLALLLRDMQPVERAEIATRFKPSGAVLHVLNSLDTLGQRLDGLRTPQLARSELDRLLSGLAPAALYATQLAEGGVITTRIDDYLHAMVPLRLALNGDDLRRMGIAPGPELGQLLACLRAVKLDGLVTTRADEENWIRAQLDANIT